MLFCSPSWACLSLRHPPSCMSHSPCLHLPSLLFLLFIPSTRRDVFFRKPGIWGEKDLIFGLSTFKSGGGSYQVRRLLRKIIFLLYTGSLVYSCSNLRNTSISPCIGALLFYCSLLILIMLVYMSGIYFGTYQASYIKYGIVIYCVFLCVWGDS